MTLNKDFIKAFLALVFATVVSIWIWPDGIFYIQFSHMTLKMIFQLVVSILLVLWGLGNLYNRLGPYLTSWLISRSIDKQDING